MNEKQLECRNFVMRLFNEAHSGARNIAPNGIIHIGDAYSQLVILLVDAGIYSHNNRNELTLLVTEVGDISYRHSDRLPGGIEIMDATYPQCKILFFACKTN